MKKAVLLGLAAVVLVAGGSVYAAQQRDKVKLDANGDGVITRAEAQAGAASLFARLDVNKDGKLDETDRKALRETMKARMFERLDSDKNGQITKAEFMSDMGGRGGHGEGRLGKGGHFGMGAGGMMRMAKMADTNGDGAISQAEFMTAALARFDAMDTNKDGQVTPAERQAARAQMKAQMQNGAGRATPG